MQDFTKAMDHMKEVHNKVQEVQKELERLEAVGESGAGAVKVVVNGKRNLVKLAIDSDYISPTDQAMLQDLIVAAVNVAQKAVEEKMRDKMQQHAGGMLAGLPMNFFS